MEVIHWLQEWGSWFYPIAFLWAFFEGETFVIFGGWGAHLGIFNIYYLVGTVWIGSFLGDQVYFWIGRKWGAKAIAKFPAAEVPAAKAIAWLEKYGIGFILTFRYLYGVRNIASVAIGTTGMRWRKFLFWNFWAAGIWAWSFAGAGYLFGEAAASVGEVAPKLLLGAVATAVLVFVARKSLKWKRRRAAALVAASDIVVPEPPASHPSTSHPRDPHGGEVVAKGAGYVREEASQHDTQRMGRIIPPALPNQLGQAQLAD